MPMPLGASVLVLVAALGCGGDPAPPCRPSALVRQVVEERATGLSAEQRHELTETLVEVGERHEVDPFLLVSVIAHESRFRPRAVGPHGSFGLMQVQPRTARAVAARHGLRVDDRESLFDIATNVRLGGAYLADLERELGTWELALGAYNMGPTRTRRHLDRGRTPGLYATPVLNDYRRLCENFGVAPDPDLEIRR